jgi:hypothetical protein
VLVVGGPESPLHATRASRAKGTSRRIGHRICPNARDGDVSAATTCGRGTSFG